MNDVVKENQFVLRRLEQSFAGFTADLWQAVPLWLLVLAVLAVAARVGYRVRTKPVHGRRDPVGSALWWTAFGSTAALVVVFLVEFLRLDNLRAAAGDGSSVSMTSTNAALWYAFTGGILGLGVLLVVWMYVKDSRAVHWYWAAPLALLRIVVYCILCFVFLLPAYQTWEKAEKRSRVVILLDISPSITDTSDESGESPGAVGKKRIENVLDFLTDDKNGFVKKLLEKNPVVVYRFGTRLDEDGEFVRKEEGNWPRNEWTAFALYDFKPFLLRGLSDDGKRLVKASPGWEGERAGNANWAQSWSALGEEEALPKDLPQADREKLKDARGKLGKRIATARTIMQGTNVADSVTAVVNRESANMLQGVVVFTDGRSNLGSDAGLAELKERSTREKIPVFTVAVGEVRETARIVVTGIQAPSATRPIEPFKVVVEADGHNLANKTAEVTFDLFEPGKNPAKDDPSHTLDGSITFGAGDPPHGQAEFLIDPRKLPPKLTQEKDGVRKMLPGDWSARAVVSTELERERKGGQKEKVKLNHAAVRGKISVVDQPPRVLLVASGPSREYQALRVLLARETQENRAELFVYLQNEGGRAGEIVQDVKPDHLLTRFPTKLVVTGKTPKPAADQPEKKGDEKNTELLENINTYDIIIAVDPDWSELSFPQAEALGRWVTEQKGGLVYVAGPLHTHQLAKVERTETGRQDEDRPLTRLLPLLNVLPVQPAEIHELRGRPIPRSPRRLYLKPMPGDEGRDLLHIDESGPGDTAGWEEYFTDRKAYAPNPDLKSELAPTRGFYSAYPVKGNVANDVGHVLAEYSEYVEGEGKATRPWLVLTKPDVPWRAGYLASGEIYRMIGYNREFYNQFWIKLAKYVGAKRDVRASRGRILVDSEYPNGGTARVQARILNTESKPYPTEGQGSLDARFKVTRKSADGADRVLIGSYPMTPKPGPSGFDGYYQGVLQLDPDKFPPASGDTKYKYEVSVDLPEGEGGEGIRPEEFGVREANPERDNVRPDTAALLAMASELGSEALTGRVPDAVKSTLVQKLPRENGVTKLAFDLADPETLALIPDCMETKYLDSKQRGPVNDLWDKGVTLAGPGTFGRKEPLTVSYVLLIVVGLLCVEWGTRKLLRLA